MYRTEEGKPLVLNVVRELLIQDRSRYKEYFPITGLTEFNKLSATLIIGGGSPVIAEKRVAKKSSYLGEINLVSVR